MSWSDSDEGFDGFDDNESNRQAKQRTKEDLEEFMKTKRDARPFTYSEVLRDGVSSQASVAPYEPSAEEREQRAAQHRYELGRAMAQQRAAQPTAVGDNRPKPHPPPNAPTQTVETRSAYLSSVLTPLATEISPIVYPDGGNPVPSTRELDPSTGHIQDPLSAAEFCKLVQSHECAAKGTASYACRGIACDQPRKSGRAPCGGRKHGPMVRGLQQITRRSPGASLEVCAA